MKAAKQNLLFDLDGTLADPYLAFSGSVQYALEKNGFTVPDEKIMRSCIGPPLQESLVEIIGVPNRQMQQVLEDYRHHHEKKGLDQYRFFAGARPMLEKARHKFSLYVATSKPHYLAVPIFAKHGMQDFFIKIYGAEKDGVRSNKGDLLKYLLSEERLEKNHTFMIGDRKHDILAARKNGIAGLGVEWGFAEPGELKEAQASQIFSSWKELGDYFSLK